MLVVDDSATMRAVIRRTIESDGDIFVVGEACDPAEARLSLAVLDCDVMTLDVEMPGMDGLAFLQWLMRSRPMPVVMVSSYTATGADATLRALELGAVDCVAKPCARYTAGFARLSDIVRAAKGAQVCLRQDTLPQSAPVRFQTVDRVLAIGASTGGVEALIAILGQFPSNCPPTLITQHMPAAFTASLAKRLGRSCAATVREATDGAQVGPGQIYLAPGGVAHLELRGPAKGPWHCRLNKSHPVNGHRPSVDILFASVAATARERAVGVILTGMGRDGARGLAAMRAAGARTLGQDEASCVVYGMPKAAHELGGVERQVPLHAVAGAMLAACNAKLAAHPHG